MSPKAREPSSAAGHWPSLTEPAAVLNAKYRHESATAPPSSRSPPPQAPEALSPTPPLRIAPQLTPRLGTRTPACVWPCPPPQLPREQEPRLLLAPTADPQTLCSGPGGRDGVQRGRGTGWWGGTWAGWQAGSWRQGACCDHDPERGGPTAFSPAHPRPALPLLCSQLWDLTRA